MDTINGRSNRPVTRQGYDQPSKLIDSTGRSVTPARPNVTHEAPKHKRISKKNWLWLLIGLVVVGVLMTVAWKLFGNSYWTGIDSSRYQVVFLADNNTNNNAYVGKLERLPDGYYRLKDAFYFQSTPAAAEDEKATAADIKLIKPGDEIHAPEDTIIIPREQILHYENLKDGGKVVDAIKKFHNDKK